MLQAISHPPASFNSIETAGFLPAVPTRIEDTGLPVTVLEDLALKLLLSRGQLCGRDLADAMHLPFKLLQPVLAELKNRMLVAHRTTAALGDFYYALTEYGKENAVQAKQHLAYTGAAPVPYDDYLKAIHQQSIRNERPTPNDLRQAFADIVISDDLLNMLGPAIHAGRGLFLFGAPGDGKSTIAERIPKCFGQDIYIPRTLWVEGEWIQLYDPQNHTLAPVNPDEKFDARWVKIHRPLVMVGGELTLDALDIRMNTAGNVCEAPLQMKANGGVFLIDDFGRQRVNHTDLLNRWIVPLEKQYDFLTLPNGKKIQVPFDPLIIFSTNLNPHTLADDAFLRRIPYKIDIQSPDEAAFRRLFHQQCQALKLACEEAVIDTLFTWYQADTRPYRACHPRDLLQQVKHACTYSGQELIVTTPLLRNAYHVYFAVTAGG